MADAMARLNRRFANTNSRLVLGNVHCECDDVVYTDPCLGRFMRTEEQGEVGTCRPPKRPLDQSERRMSYFPAYSETGHYNKTLPQRSRTSNMSVARAEHQSIPSSTTELFGRSTKI
ncbi:hypothetical protein CBL_11956 [Carabus blaptoides fortunei]